LAAWAWRRASRLWSRAGQAEEHEASNAGTNRSDQAADPTSMCARLADSLPIEARPRRGSADLGLG
jgi:hypothetical protein